MVGQYMIYLPEKDSFWAQLAMLLGVMGFFSPYHGALIPLRGVMTALYHPSFTTLVRIESINLWK